MIGNPKFSLDSNCKFKLYMKKIYSNWRDSALKLSFLLVFSLCTILSFGQQQVAGQVLDEFGDPVQAATVRIVGQPVGTITDLDGRWTLPASDGDVIEISFIGLSSQQFVVGQDSFSSISLAEDTASIEDVVVIGYQSQTRGDISGSVSSVNVDEAVKVPIVNASEALQGRAAGVSVINNGNPGGNPQVRIRGFGSTGAQNPLFIIDGVQTTNANVLNSINPSDILQMNVLKDGAAAIYGARAANGVVIITTKSGSYNQNGPKLSFDAYTGFSRAVNQPELLNAQQHGDVIFQSLINDGLTPSHPQYGSGATPVVPSTLQGVPVVANIAPGGTDWLDAITQDAPTTSASFGLENGTENSKFLLSANYLNRDGIQRTSGFTQGLVRLNSEFRLLNKKLTIGNHLSSSFGNTVGGNQINNALRSSPLIPTFDSNGNFGGTYNPAAGLGNARSPLAQLERGSNNFNRLFRGFGDVYASVNLFNDFTVKTSLGGALESFKQRLFTSLDPEHSEPITTNTLAEQDINNIQWTWTNTLNYVKNLGDHSINAIGGVEAVDDSSRGQQVSRTGFLFEDPDFYLLSNGSGTPLVNFAFDGSTRLSSLFGSANYGYKDKYFFTGTVREDTSSRLAPENRSEVFFSGSAAWDISKESFFPSGGTVNRLKLRASYGELGNVESLPNRADLNIFSLNEQLGNYSFGGGVAPGVILSSSGNSALVWETSESTNFGLDFGLFNDKLYGSVEYFDILTDDLIASTANSTTGPDASPASTNFGSIENTGIDLLLGYGTTTNSGFTYGFEGTFSRYKNEVVELANAFQFGNGGFRGGAVTRTEAGEPISQFFGRQVTGFDNNGRFTYEDINGDGVINDDDRTVIGTPHPDFVWGANFNAAFKGFDLTAFFNGSQGNDIYNYEKIFSDFPTFFNGNRSTRVLDSWTPTNTDAILPALSQSITNDETQPNSYFVEDGSYTRLKNLQLGYTFPSSFTESLNMESFRLYLRGTNLFTITDYQGFDPEINGQAIGSGDALTQGVDFNVFPQAQILTVGANVKFGSPRSNSTASRTTSVPIPSPSVETVEVIKEVEVEKIVEVEKEVIKEVEVEKIVEINSDSDGDGVVDSKDNCPSVAGPITNYGCPVTTTSAPTTRRVTAPSTTVVERLNFVAKSVLFDTNSDNLRSESVSSLNEIYSIMSQYPSSSFVVEGHTDDVGDAGYNKTLSQKRAQSVVNYLVSKGMSSSNLTAIGYGEEAPISSNSTEAGRQANRRVVIKLR